MVHARRRKQPSRRTSRRKHEMFHFHLLLLLLLLLRRLQTQPQPQSGFRDLRPPTFTRGHRACASACTPNFGAAECVSVSLGLSSDSLLAGLASRFPRSNFVLLTLACMLPFPSILPFPGSPESASPSSISQYHVGTSAHSANYSPLRWPSLPTRHQLSRRASVLALWPCGFTDNMVRGCGSKSPALRDKRCLPCLP
jgi:hypothetical protein